MRWSDDYISFGPEDHSDTKLSERNLPLVVKILIGRHKVIKISTRQHYAQHNKVTGKNPLKRASTIFESACLP
jgi:hypothetical protein